jgi:hypothetical protein
MKLIIEFDDLVKSLSNWEHRPESMPAYQCATQILIELMKQLELKHVTALHNNVRKKLGQ